MVIIMRHERIYLRDNDPNIFLDTYIPDKTINFTRRAILVIPGGAYHTVCSQREGEPIAHAFMAKGFASFVLHYSVARTRTFPAQLIEASLAMAHIKNHAEEYGIDPNEVFVTGFSAGGHLACSLGLLWHLDEIYRETGLPFGINKPRGMILGYPVTIYEGGHKGSHRNLWGTETPSEEQIAISSLEKHVDERSVPLFLMHTSDDEVVPIKSALDLGLAYAEKGLSFEMHIYPHGPHGVALANAITANGREDLINEATEKWVDMAIYWAKNLKD